jgi:hypothetical protein
MTRENEAAFEHAGRNGCWRLAEHGDGHRNNLAALVAALGRYPCPLHVEDLHAVVAAGRDVTPGTLRAALQRTDTFHRVDGAVFGLVGRAYDAANPITAWVEREVGEADALTLAELRERAAAEGIPPEAVRGAAVLSTRVTYRKAAFDKAPAAIVRRAPRRRASATRQAREMRA